MQIINLSNFNLKEKTQSQYLLISAIICVLSSMVYINNEWIAVMLLTTIILFVMSKYYGDIADQKLTHSRQLLDQLDLVINNTHFHGKQCDWVHGCIVKDSQTHKEKIEQLCCSPEGQWFLLTTQLIGFNEIKLEVIPSPVYRIVNTTNETTQ